VVTEVLCAHSVVAKSSQSPIAVPDEKFFFEGTASLQGFGDLLAVFQAQISRFVAVGNWKSRTLRLELGNGSANRCVVVL